MKKGFTLIELLAVIVILAIIALIATPIVLSIINDVKQSALLRSSEYYITGIENSIMKKSMNTGTAYKPNVCIVYSNGDLLCDNEDILVVEVKGEKPTSGEITFEEGKVANINLKYPGATVTLNNKGELVLGEPEEEKVTLVNYIKNLYTPTTTTTVNDIEYDLDATNLLMNDRLGNSEVGKTDGNIRYYGANPNNYIDIGDRDSEGNIIFWRIIGVFKDIEVTDKDGNVIKTEDLVKIIRADYLALENINKFSWDYTSMGEYDSNWHDSTLQLMLNDEANGYYGSGTTIYYNDSTTPTPLSFSSIGLSSKVHNKVERVKWSLGGHTNTSIYADVMYGYERAGTNIWSGKIALMYPSDYGYSADLSSCQTTLYEFNNSTCTTANWMHDLAKGQWTLIPNTSSTYRVFIVCSNGSVDSGYRANLAYGIRPVLYLNSEVSIVEEKETSEGLKYFVVE